MDLVNKLFGYLDKILNELDDYTGWLVVGMVLIAAGRVFKLKVNVGGGK